MKNGKYTKFSSFVNCHGSTLTLRNQSEYVWYKTTQKYEIRSLSKQKNFQCINKIWRETKVSAHKVQHYTGKHTIQEQNTGKMPQTGFRTVSCITEYRLCDLYAVTPAMFKFNQSLVWMQWGSFTITLPKQLVLLSILKWHISLT